LDEIHHPIFPIQPRLQAACPHAASGAFCFFLSAICHLPLPFAIFRPMPVVLLPPIRVHLCLVPTIGSVVKNAVKIPTESHPNPSKSQ
jgi:hypothetical protein